MKLQSREVMTKWNICDVINHDLIESQLTIVYRIEKNHASIINLRVTIFQTQTSMLLYILFLFYIRLIYIFTKFIYTDVNS